MIGKTLGHYQITEKLGEGGMGVVYKARDIHLDRFAALKVLPPEKVSDPDRKRRFIQEAKAASALNHPNIITIYDIDQADGIDFIAMEYVAGKTLDDLIPRKGMRLPLALKYAVQIADALARAHGAGIIHRDLKPSNLMVDEHGLVKVLDFGLAKLTEAVGPEAETVSTGTTTGAIVGTPAYMSPEQAEGKHIDTRSDIFSFGSILYEMLTGQRAFRGDTRASTIASILREEPKAISQVAEGLPREVERIIRRCLRKDPEHRFQYMADLRVALEELKEESDSGALGEAGAPKAVVRSRLWWVGAVAGMAVILVALGIVGWFWLGRSRPAEPEASMVPVPFTSYRGREGRACFSPDGNQVVFAWNGEQEDNWDIYIKQVGDETARRLTTDPRLDGFPGWSPDGQSIAFLRSLDGARTAVILISPNGGRERQVAELPTLKTASHVGLCWYPSGKYLAVVCDQAPAEAPCGIFLLSTETGEKRLLCSPPKTIRGDSSPAFSPDGRSLVFCRYLTGTLSQLYLLQVSQAILPEGEPKQLTFGDQPASNPAWTADGREIVYACGRSHRGALWRIPASGGDTPKPLPFSGGSADSPAISLQKRRLVYTLLNSDIDIWRCEIPRAGEYPGPPSKLIATTQTEHQARYSPDGKEIAYVSYSSGSTEIWICDSDGSHPYQATHLGGPEPDAPSWSPDGRRIIYQRPSGKSLDLFLIPAQGGKEKQLTQTPDNGSRPCFSNDGRWIYFASDRSGEFQIWRMAEDGGKATQITRKGGINPAITKDGKTLYYLKGETIGLATHDLWKVPEEGGEESRVLGGVLRMNFEVTEKGVYYATQSAPGVTEFLLYGFADGKTKDIATIRFPVQYGFTVSPDDRWILYTAMTNFRSDLMLVENFR